ncbi:MAG: FtsX-like permease family protein [Bacteroidales bacterium]|nr:FtsX-like permease family protein [Bacteroidales bacterium]
MLAAEIKKSTSVKEISFTSYMPTEQGYNQNVWWEGMQENHDEYLNWISADENFISLMGINLQQGRNFDKNMGSDKDAYIINELAQKKIGWKNPIGKIMDITGKGEVIGVVDNFNFKSLHNFIEPVALKIYPGIYKYLYIKTLPNSVHSALNDIRKVWSGLFPDRSFEYTFLEDNLTEVYKKEVNESETIKYISIFAILIASMGILGLSSLLVTNRTKEIGIRKVNGARISEILSMLIRDLVKWVAIAFVIATPLAYFAMHKWLGNFAYKTALSWWIFAAAGIIALVIALLTVSLQSWRAATRNPVESLRYE